MQRTTDGNPLWYDCTLVDDGFGNLVRLPLPIPELRHYLCGYTHENITNNMVRQAMVKK